MDLLPMTAKTLLAAALVALATPAMAAYTECTVKKDTDIVNSPGGHVEPRWPTLKKGDDVSIRDVHQDWIFVTFFRADQYRYGWLRRNVLINCEQREGTP
jgi:hypothetical protein